MSDEPTPVSDERLAYILRQAGAMLWPINSLTDGELLSLLAELSLLRRLEKAVLGWWRTGELALSADLRARFRDLDAAADPRGEEK